MHCIHCKAVGANLAGCNRQRSCLITAVPVCSGSKACAGLWGLRQALCFVPCALAFAQKFLSARAPAASSEHHTMLMCKAQGALHQRHLITLRRLACPLYSQALVPPAGAGEEEALELCTMLQGSVVEAVSLVRLFL